MAADQYFTIKVVITEKEVHCKLRSFFNYFLITYASFEDSKGPSSPVSNNFVTVASIVKKLRENSLYSVFEEV